MKKGKSECEPRKPYGVRRYDCIENIIMDRTKAPLQDAVIMVLKDQEMNEGRMCKEPRLRARWRIRNTNRGKKGMWPRRVNEGRLYTPELSVTQSPEERLGSKKNGGKREDRMV